MRLKKDYIKNPIYKKDFGAEAIAQLEEEAAAIPAEACPFCGGDPVIELGFFYTANKTVRVMCSSCKIGTAPKIDGATVWGVNYTVLDCLAAAAAEWNRRQP